MKYCVVEPEEYAGDLNELKDLDGLYHWAKANLPSVKTKEDCASIAQEYKDPGSAAEMLYLLKCGEILDRLDHVKIRGTIESFLEYTDIEDELEDFTEGFMEEVYAEMPGYAEKKATIFMELHATDPQEVYARTALNLLDQAAAGYNKLNALPQLFGVSDKRNKFYKTLEPQPAVSLPG